jgi:hypothetical protein
VSPAHRSPAAQQVAPHAGPAGQPRLAAHDAGSASTPPSEHARFVHETPDVVQSHELQPSPAGNVSPIECGCPMNTQSPPPPLPCSVHAHSSIAMIAQRMMRSYTYSPRRSLPTQWWQ